MSPPAAAVPAPPHPAPQARWQGELELGFARRGEATVLARRQHRGPLQVQRPFYPEGSSPCHVYVLHPPGGLVAGDDMQVRAQLDAGAHALLTTPAATKVYRRGGAGPCARQAQSFAVAPGGRLEWLPAETIVFDGGAVELSTRVDLDGDAGFIGWEVLCLGRPASGEGYARGRCRQRFEVWRQGRPLVVERTRIDGGSPLQAAAHGLQGAPVSGTLLASLDGGAGAGDLLEAVRALAAALPAGERAAATAVEGALLVRYLGGRAGGALALFIAVWELLRPALLGLAPFRPRIWMT